MVGHVAPEAARGGPIGKVQDGDRIVIDVDKRIVETDADLDSRAAGDWAPHIQCTGTFAKYAALVGSASHGAVTTPC